MDNQGTTSNDNEITQEGAMPSSSTTSGSNINYEGTTSNNTNMKEGMNASSNNNDIKEGMISTSNNHDISEDHVTLFVAYDGKWDFDGKEWLFKESKGSMIVVSKYVTLSEITHKLCEKFEVQDNYGLKLEFCYRVGFPIIEIECDEDLSLFMSKSSKTELLLCVTVVVPKDDIDGGVEEDEINQEIEEESPHGQINTEIKEESPHGQINIEIKEESPHVRKGDTVEDRLLKAIQKGDWMKAREIVNTKKVTWTSKLDDFGNTALHFAVGEYKDNEVVRDILRGINSKLLETSVDIQGMNPTHFAAAHGNIEALNIILDSNPKCLFIPDINDLLPIHYALEIPAIKTFLYLFKQMKSYKDEYDILFRSKSTALSLLHRVIDTGLIDVAYELINDFPSLATEVYEDKTALECIIRRPELFYSGTYNDSFSSRFVYHMIPIENNSLGSNDTADVENQESPKKDKFVTKHTRRCLHDVISRIYFKLLEATFRHVPHVKHLRDDKVMHNTAIQLLRRICEEADKKYTSSDIKHLYCSPFCLAVENNTPEAIDVLTTYFPGLYNSMKHGKNIYELIVLNCSEKVYSYILHHQRFAKSGFSASKDVNGNNILHLAGHLAPIHKLNAAYGATLQMQRELQWFEEVKKVVGMAHTRALNKHNETPMMVFRKEHQELRKEGEEWIKRTADSYAVTSALIIAIVFAAAITVPGGNDSATGKPIYETKASLIIFAISDAISLFTSTTSLLLFLSVITGRYRDEDFLYRSPSRFFILGLVMLFVSLISMLIAFSAALYIMFGQGKAWILIPIAALACLPIASVVVQFPLLVEVIFSTYGHGILGKEKYYWQSSANANKKKRT